MAELKLTNPNSGTIQLTNDPGRKWLTSTQTEGLRFDDAGVSFTTGGTSVTPLSGLPIGTELSFHKENTGSANTINAPSGETFPATLTLTSEGDFWTIRKVASTEWRLIGGYESDTRWRANFDGVLEQWEVRDVQPTGASGGMYATAYTITHSRLFSDSDYHILSSGEADNGIQAFAFVSIDNRTKTTGTVVVTAYGIINGTTMTATPHFIGRWY